MSSVMELFSDNQRLAINPGNPSPLYHQLYSLLKNSILTGTIGTGKQMPTELELSQGFDVSRITAKRAMDELAQESLVQRRRGKGTHVTYEYRPKPVKAPLVGMLEEIETMARHTDVKVITCEQQLPPKDVQQLMGIEEGQQALHLIRVRAKDGEPFGYYSSWTQGLQSPITAAQLQKKTRLELFRKQGLNITHVTQTISATAADATLAEELNTEVGSPLISITRHSYSNDPSGTDPTNCNTEVLVDYLQLFYHPQRFQYRMDLQVEQD